MGDSGGPSFNLLQNFGSGDVPIFYYVFDVLVLSGRDVLKSASTLPLGDSGWGAFSLRPNLPGGKMVLAAKEPIDKGKKRRGGTAFLSMYRKIKLHVLEHDQCWNRVLSKFRK